MMHIARPPQCLAAPSAALSSRRAPHTEAPWAGHTVAAQPCERLSAGLACSSHQRLPLRRRTRRVEVIAHAHERVASAGVAERTSSVESLDEAPGLHRSGSRAAKVRLRPARALLSGAAACLALTARLPLAVSTCGPGETECFLSSPELRVLTVTLLACQATPLYVMLPLDTVSVLNKLNHVQVRT
jgi:hypothetical protein